MVRLLALQMTSGPNVQDNLNWVEKKLANCGDLTNTIVVLPECFACFGTRDGRLLEVAETKGAGQIQDALKRLARTYGCYIVSGTLPLKTECEDKFSASALLFEPSGNVIAEYQKIHLFDVAVSDGTKNYCESKYTQPGNKVVVVDTPLGKIGMAVCYDIRFSGLFDAMGDIDILVIPAAFTRVTGEAHWHTLLRSRAIEKQCFVVAANQTGIHANQRETFGHSLVYSPWGKKLAEITEPTGACGAEVDISERNTLAAKMPVASHNMFRSYFVKSS